MFRLLLKSIAFTIVLIALLSYGLYLKTGSWIVPGLDKLLTLKTQFKLEKPKLKPISVRNKAIAPNKKAYKWQDEKGVWHYDTKKPEHYDSVEIVQ